MYHSYSLKSLCKELIIECTNAELGQLNCRNIKSLGYIVAKTTNSKKRTTTRMMSPYRVRKHCLEINTADQLDHSQHSMREQLNTVWNSILNDAEDHIRFIKNTCHEWIQHATDSVTITYANVSSIRLSDVHFTWKHFSSIGLSKYFKKLIVPMFCMANIFTDIIQY